MFNQTYRTAVPRLSRSTRSGALTPRAALVAVLFLLLFPSRSPAQDDEKIRVVATLPTFAAIARELTGDLAVVEAIARGDQDPHFVVPRPSFAAMLSDADLLITTGLDLELWLPALIDRARNAKIVDGSPGQVVAYSGVKLLEVPENVSRRGGDVHVFGNPHIHSDPINGIIIARNIFARLRAVDPGYAPMYEANLERFEERILRRTFGDELFDILGPGALFGLARKGEFWSFARNQSYQGKPLVDYLGGWLAEAAPFRDQTVVCYHKNWAYFEARFRVECGMFVEPKPGIPPSPGHVRDVIDFIRKERIPVILAANYYSRTQVERVAERTGAEPVIVAEHVAGAEGVDDYVILIDLWVSQLAEAFERHDRAENPSSNEGDR